MPRTQYATEFDVVMRFHPGISRSDVTGDSYLPDNNVDRIRSAVEHAGSIFETKTGTALREVRQGSTSSQGTWEVLQARRLSTFPAVYTLDHMHVHPFDSGKGDAIEVRTQRNNWKDITSDEGTRWVISDNRAGKLEFYSRLRTTIQFRVEPGTRFVRLTYRYGGLGSDPTRGGETALDTNLSGSQKPSNMAVKDASRLPAGGGVVLVGGSEYIRITNVDPANDEVDVVDRGLRLTDNSTDHSSGDTIHYCPMAVREAIAAKAAQRLVRFDAFVDSLLDDNEDVSPSEKTDAWEEEFQSAVARYASMGYA